MTYKVTVRRDGKWWMITIPELDGLTQAKRLADAELMAKEYIASMLDIAIDSVSVDVELSQS